MTRRSVLAAFVVSVLGISAPLPGRAQGTPDRAAILASMKRATAFMGDKVAYKGGYVGAFLPGMSRGWGEREARPTMIWIQPPGTPSMGHLFLDALHAT